MDLPDNQPGSLLDPEQITMLIEAGAENSLDLFSEILALFEEESRSKLAELKACRDNGQYESLGRAAHALAGSSANIGARQLWQDAKAVENLCREGKGAEAAERIPQLEETLDESLLQLRHFVSNLDTSGQ